MVNKRNAILTILLIPFFKPAGVVNYQIINFVFKFLKLNSLCWIGYMMLTTGLLRHKIKMNSGIVGLVIFWIIYISNNIVNRVYDSDIINNALSSLFLMWFIIYESKKGNFKNILLALTGIFKTWIWIQFISVILTKNGIHLFGTLVGDYLYFLGTDNYSSFMLLPMLGIVLFSQQYCTCLEKTSKKAYIYVILYTLINLYTKSYTAFISGSIVLTLFLIYNMKRNLLKIFSVKKLLCGILLFVLLVVVFDIPKYFSFILVDILHKGISLSTRTYIWDATLQHIKERPILGFGSTTAEQVKSFFFYGTTHAHNIFLDLMIRTGIIGTISYIIFMVWPISTVYRNKRWKELYILLIFYAAQLVLSIMDFYVIIPYFYCFIAVLYAMKLNNKRNIMG